MTVDIGAKCNILGIKYTANLSNTLLNRMDEGDWEDQEWKKSGNEGN